MFVWRDGDPHSPETRGVAEWLVVSSLEDIPDPDRLAVTLPVRVKGDGVLGQLEGCPSEHRDPAIGPLHADAGTGDHAVDARTHGLGNHARHVFQCPALLAQLGPRESLGIAVRFLSGRVQRKASPPAGMTDGEWANWVTAHGPGSGGVVEADAHGGLARLVAFREVADLPERLVSAAPVRLVLVDRHGKINRAGGVTLPPTIRPREAARVWFTRQGDDADRRERLVEDAARHGCRIAVALPAWAREPQSSPLDAVRNEVAQLRAELAVLKSA